MYLAHDFPSPEIRGLLRPLLLLCKMSHHRVVVERLDLDFVEVSRQKILRRHESLSMDRLHG